MKKLLFVFLSAFIAVSANAQLHFGGSFSINFDNEHTDYFSGASKNKENAYLVNLKPKLYWNLTEKMQVGGRIGFAFGRLNTGLIYDAEKKEQTDIVNRALGWSLSPFFGYRVLNWKRISVWAEANVCFGQCYNTEKNKTTTSEWGTRTEYGVQILPYVNFDLTESLSLQLHVGFLSLGWYGTTSRYPDRVVRTSTWDLHKGGFAGILQGLTDYGIGLVKKF